MTAFPLLQYVALSSSLSDTAANQVETLEPAARAGSDSAGKASAPLFSNHRCEDLLFQIYLSAQNTEVFLKANKEYTFILF